MPFINDPPVTELVAPVHHHNNPRPFVAVSGPASRYIVEDVDTLSGLLLRHVLQLLLAFRGQPIINVLRFLQPFHRLMNIENYPGVVRLSMSFNKSGIIVANSIASVGTEGGGDWASPEVREESVATD